MERFPEDAERQDSYIELSRGASEQALSVGRQFDTGIATAYAAVALAQFEAADIEEAANVALRIRESEGTVPPEE